MKSNLFSLYKTDEIAEKEGNWFAVGDGLRFKIKRYGGANNSAVAEFNAKFQKPLINKIKAGVVTDKELYLVALKTFVHACLVGWEGIKDENGEDIPFTLENAISVLEPLEDLSDILLKHASNFQNFKEELGNS